MRFWDASGVALRPLYKLSTAGLFQTDCEHADSLAQAAEDDWPPFRKVGPSPGPGEPGPGSALCHQPFRPAGGLLRPLQRRSTAWRAEGGALQVHRPDGGGRHRGPGRAKASPGLRGLGGFLEGLVGW